MNTTHQDKILVVDDATANLQLLINLLTKHGYTVYPASDGELALEFVRSTLPDLILPDIRIPPEETSIGASATCLWSAAMRPGHCAPHHRPARRPHLGRRKN